MSEFGKVFDSIKPPPQPEKPTLHAPQPSAIEGWARVELMGHRIRYGYVREVEMLGVKLLRIDVLGEDPASPGGVEFYGASAIYCLGLITEERARKAVEPYRPRLTGPEVHDMARDHAHDADFDDEEPF